MSGSTQTALIALNRTEAHFYDKLRGWSNRDDALQFIWQVLNSRPAIEGDEPQRWGVPSASEEGQFYWVDIELRVCDCPGFRFKRHCPHLTVADRAALLRLQLPGPAHGPQAECGACEAVSGIPALPEPQKSNL